MWGHEGPRSNRLTANDGEACPASDNSSSPNQPDVRAITTAPQTMLPMLITCRTPPMSVELAELTGRANIAIQYVIHEYTSGGNGLTETLLSWA
jgi:hypothetical protein